jgi:hypothetical protein
LQTETIGGVSYFQSIKIMYQQGLLGGEGFVCMQFSFACLLCFLSLDKIEKHILDLEEKYFQTLNLSSLPTKLFVV